MAIKISNLQQISDQYKTDVYTYKDLHLDISTAGVWSEVSHSNINGNDIKLDYDEFAIRNSLRNLFNTRPGQRFLFPLYGLDLYQFVFEPITQNNAKLIGNQIVNAVDTFEPRVKVKGVSIIAMPEDNQYDITIEILYPTFNTVTSLNSVLDIRTQSFIFVQTSRNS